MQKYPDCAGLTEAHDHMLGEVMHPGNSLWHTGSGDLSVFNLFPGKHRELTTHAPGEPQNHGAKKVIKHVLNCETVTKPQRLWLREQPESTHCAWAVNKWLVDSDPQASVTHVQAHRWTGCRDFSWNCTLAGNKSPHCQKRISRS